MFQCLKEVNVYQFILIDDDFEMTIFPEDARAKYSFFVDVCVANEYSKRNLNVEANLALYYKWLEKQIGCSFDVLRRTDHPTYPGSTAFWEKYSPGIKKYMAIL